MANQHTNEAIEIVARVSLEQMGSVIALLTRLGVEQVTHRLVEETHAYKKKIVHDMSSQDALLPWVKDHPTFKAIEACRFFKSIGRSPSTTYHALTTLVEDGVLKKLGEGNYAHASMKALPAPKKKAKAAKKAKTAKAKAVKIMRGSDPEINNSQFLLRVASRNHGRFSRATMLEHFKKDGRNPASMGFNVNDLIKKGQLKRVGEGEYVLLRGGEAKKPPTKKKPAAVPAFIAPKANGPLPAEA